MAKIRIDNFRIGEEVLVNTYNPPLEGKVADMYELPFEQIPMTDPILRDKYYGKNVKIFEVFVGGKLLSFVSDVVTKK